MSFFLFDTGNTVNAIESNKDRFCAFYDEDCSNLYIDAGNGGNTCVIYFTKNNLIECQSSFAGFLAGKEHYLRIESTENQVCVNLEKLSENRIAVEFCLSIGKFGIANSIVISPEVLLKFGDWMLAQG